MNLETRQLQWWGQPRTLAWLWVKVKKKVVAFGGRLFFCRPARWWIMVAMNRKDRMICLSNCINRDSCGMMQRGDNPPVTLLLLLLPLFTSSTNSPTLSISSFKSLQSCCCILFWSNNKQGRRGIERTEPSFRPFFQSCLKQLFVVSNFFKLLDSNEQKLTILSLTFRENKINNCKHYCIYTKTRSLGPLTSRYLPFNMAVWPTQKSERPSKIR